MFLLYRLRSTNEDNTDLFIVSPGDGEEFVYSPVGANATLQCAVNNTILTWVVDGLSLDNPVHKPVLNSRGILQSEATTSMDGTTASSLIVLSNRKLNNARICCHFFANELKENCTTLVIYGKVINSILFKIYWNNCSIILLSDRPSPPTRVCSKCWQW